MHILGHLPEKQIIHQARPDAPFEVKDIGALSIAGYVGLQRGPEELSGDVIVPQPFVLHDGRPAIRPFKFERATDHTFYTFENRIHPAQDQAEEIGRLVINSGSMVIVPHDTSETPYIHLNGPELLQYLYVTSSGGHFKSAVIFEEPIPYDESIFFSNVEKTAHLVLPPRVPQLSSSSSL